MEETTEKQEWVWALVGNIKEEHEFGETHEVKKGTKHFSPGTKVYLSCSHWGDGYENINVIGKPRHTRKYIAVVMRREYIENFRMQKIYKPSVISRMKEDKGWGGFWDDSEKSRLEIITYLNFLNLEEAEKEREKVIEDGNLYADIENFCIYYWKAKIGHTICCFDNSLEVLDHFLADDELPVFVDYINKTFGTNLNTAKHTYITLDALYKAIEYKTLEDDNYLNFYYEYDKKIDEWKKSDI